MKVRNRKKSSKGTTIAAAAFLTVMALAGLSLLGAPSADQSSVQGKLVMENGKPALLESGGKRVQLQSADDSIVATLGDERLSGRELRLVGRPGPEGVFQVDDFYVVHGSTLYRLIYFCDTCHITTFRPGNCQCCQQPTVPVEVPLTDPRVHREDIRRLPSA